jgi:hypothetical protein
MQLLLSLTTDAASPLPVTCLALSRSLRLLPTEQTLAAGDVAATVTVSTASILHSLTEQARSLQFVLDSEARTRGRQALRLRGRPRRLRRGGSAAAAAAAAACCLISCCVAESILQSRTWQGRSW